MSIKVPVVNENDEIIEYKIREELDLTKDIVRSASLWITNSKGEILLAQRKFNKRTDPGKWAEAVGGTVGGGDLYEATAYREADEELGIKDVEFTVGPKQFVVGPQNGYFVQWYCVILDWPIEKFILQESEVEQIAWWDFTNLHNDLSEHPEKYIDALPEMIGLLY